jgi:4-amino-4-deoxy-L-arabinose transferase-like glycosyltransferase
MEWSETLNIASNLTDYGVFAGAYGKSGPSAHSAPLYPLLLSVLYRVFETDQLGRVFIASIFSTVLASLVFALLPLLAKASRIPVRVGIMAGFFGAMLPVSHWIQTKGVFEYELSAVTVLIFTIVFTRCWTKQDFSQKWAIGSGVASGAMLLTIPPFAIPIVVLAIVGYYVAQSAARKQFIRFTVVQFCLAAALLLPWTVRNYIVMGSPIWARSNAGLELYLSNNDRASAFWDVNLINSLHPRLIPSEEARVRQLGEVGYNREKMQQAETWIKNHPQRFVSLAVQRIFFFWFPKMTSVVQTLITAVITGLAFWGFGRFWKTRAVASRFFLTLGLAYALPLCIFQTSERLRAPIDWSFYFFTAYLVWTFLRRPMPKLMRTGPISAVDQSSLKTTAELVQG